MIISCLLLAGCMSRGDRLADGSPSVSVPFVYARYLAFPTPSYGIVAEFNPPVLRWPIVDGTQPILYDVRLSKDSLFDGEVISAQRTPWALFNAHIELEKGDWYWQYRVSGGEWSQLNHFVIDETAVKMVSPHAKEFLSSVPTYHPRVLASRDKVPTLKKLAGDEDTRRILGEANAILTQRIPHESDGKPRRIEEDRKRSNKLRQDASSSLGKIVYTSISTLCQAWMLSGDQRYAQRAQSIADEVSGWDPDGVTGSETNDFADARCMLAMALVFDTFYDDLNAEQRFALTKSVFLRADRFYRSWINNQEARVLSGHVWQHILHYFFQTALAMYGHQSEAEAWLAFAYELFLARAPILGGKDGGWAEGASYFRMNMETMIDIPLIIKQHTGFDFINTHPWYSKNVDWLVYHLPPGSSSDGFGDNAEDVWSPGAEYIAYANELAKLAGNQMAWWYVQECRRYEQADLSSVSTLRWIRLTKTRDIAIDLPSQVPALTSARLFSDIGLVSMHSNPANTPKNLMVALRSSPFGCYGHFLADQNAFNILYGGKRTFFRTGYKVTMTDPHRTGWYQHTRSNNSLLIDGAGQPYSTESFGWIRRFIDGKQVAYALGDASNAYSSSETGEDYALKKFYRHILLLKPDIVVIYDELEATRPVEWSWLIHSMSDIHVDPANNSFRSGFENCEGSGRLWSTTPTRFILRDTFDVPAVNWRGSKDASGRLKSYEENQWHLKAVTSSKVPVARFLAVLRISSHAVSGRDTLYVDEQSSPLRITAGDWEIVANLDAGDLAALDISNENGSVRFRFQGADLPVLTETVNGVERLAESADIFPWNLRQSVLAHTRAKQQH